MCRMQKRGVAAQIAFLSCASAFSESPKMPNYMCTRILGKFGAPGLWCSTGISPVLGSLDGGGIILRIGQFGCIITRTHFCKWVDVVVNHDTRGLYVVAQHILPYLQGLVHGQHVFPWYYRGRIIRRLIQHFCAKLTRPASSTCHVGSSGVFPGVLWD